MPWRLATLITEPKVIRSIANIKIFIMNTDLIVNYVKVIIKNILPFNVIQAKPNLSPENHVQVRQKVKK